ncbi:nuclear transport factor 2 family protein [Roseospira navarrensis]|uniref:Nuclear transport factor 2 family protein n=1 Tax=Roseospira navarrensis TaxID=140058 RepID=A0A7X2D1P2_9PROT|nr:nuclear transport factor 2 family protein [Roseospira navarrensis]MQX34913.1 nuclear transport factor 2 family protein [Roseospira navarrensis]
MTDPFFEPPPPAAPSQVVVHGAARYVAFFEGMTPEALDRLAEVATADIHFVDPFNDTVGLPALRRILAAMYQDTQDPCFRVTHRAFDGDVCFLRWVFTARIKALGGDWRIDGMSEVRFAEDGRAREHIDHWDAARQFHERLPVLGWVLRRVRRRLAHGKRAG